MIGVIFSLASEMIEVRIIDNQCLFKTGHFGGSFVPIDSLKLSKQGVTKEFPDLKENENWKEEAIKRFKGNIKNMKSETERIDYVIKDLSKFGYKPLYKQRRIYICYKTPLCLRHCCAPITRFEFTNKSYGHGDNIMLSNHSGGYFSICSRMGGLIYSQGNSMLPVYQGMRVDCNTMRPTKDFSVFVKNVDRSKSKALVKSYEKLFKVSETMFKAMDHASFKASAREVITDIDNYISHWGKTDELFTKGFGLIEESPFDAMTYMILGLNTNYWLSTLAHNKYEPHALYVSAKKSILKELYRRNPIFTEREFKAGETYPASTWGITLRVDGKEVEQCY